LQFFPSFTVPDNLIAVLMVYGLSIAIYPVAMGLGNWLKSSGNEDAEALREDLDVVAVPAKG